MTEWLALPDAQAVAQQACDRIVRSAREAIATRGVFRLVLAGGSTPMQTYRLLAGSDQEWANWQLFYGDERCLPPTHPDRNSLMIESTGLLAKGTEHFPMPAELGAEQGAEAYAQVIGPRMPFDLVLLGMGEDGHTASLFPGHTWADANVMAVHDSPKPPSDRISLSMQALQSCAQMLVMVTGEGKRQATEAWRQGAVLPIAQVADVPNATVLVEASLME